MKKNESIFIAGHNGLIGSAIHKVFIDNDYKNINILDRSDLNLENQSQVEDFFCNVSNECGSFSKQVLDAILYRLTFNFSKISIASG